MRIIKRSYARAAAAAAKAPVKPARPGMSLPHLATRLFNVPLMIHPEKLEIILAAVGPRFGVQSAQVLSFNDPGEDDDDQQDSKSAALAANQGVAVIPVYGTLVKRGNMLAYSGMTSYPRLRTEIAAALANPECVAIVLDEDSPGGESAGMFGLADFIASARGSKPIVAIANDAAYSAAYGIGSSADRVLVTDIGGTGSIGCYMLHCDMSQADAEQGLKYTYIFSGDRKVDGNPHAPLSEAALATAKAEVDRVRGMFVETVSRNRNIDAQSIYDTEAACFMGPASCPMLADDVGTLADAIELAAAMSKGARSILMPRGVDPALLKSEATAADGCECGCRACGNGECSQCTNDECDDPSCEGCPMQDRDSKNTERLIRRMLLGGVIEKRFSGGVLLALRSFGTLALAGEPGQQKLSGILAPYGSLSCDLGGFREIYEAGCFADSLRSDDPRVVFNHNSDLLLARKSANTARFWEEPNGLHYDADLPDTQCARDLTALMKRGDIRESSAAFYILSHRWEQRSGIRTRIVEKARLVEGSPCSFPAYESSTAIAVDQPQSIAVNHDLELSRARLRLLKLT